MEKKQAQFRENTSEGIINDYANNKVLNFLSGNVSKRVSKC